MSFAFYYDAPGTEPMYQHIKELIGSDRPAGLVLLLVTKIDGGLRHLNVWESREDWDRFRKDHVEPAVTAALQAIGVPAPTAPPEEHGLSVVDIQT